MRRILILAALLAWPLPAAAQAPSLQGCLPLVQPTIDALMEQIDVLDAKIKRMEAEKEGCMAELAMRQLAAEISASSVNGLWWFSAHSNPQFREMHAGPIGFAEKVLMFLCNVKETP